MTFKPYVFDEVRIKRFLSEGRGSGKGKHYKPWLMVSDVPSLGRVHRVFCPKTKREHHLLSDNEYYAFLLQWWDDNVLDIREKFPLIDRRETFELAALCGVNHPVDPSSGALWVITTDLLLTVRTAYGTEIIAYAVEEAKALSDERTLEKLEIERRYWERREVQWRILTNEQVKSKFTQNLSWVLDGNDIFFKQNYKEICKAIKQELVMGQRIQPRMPIRFLCGIIDQKNGYKLGTSLAVLRWLLGMKIIYVDLNARSIQDLPARAFSIQGGDICVD